MSTYTNKEVAEAMAGGIEIGIGMVMKSVKEILDKHTDMLKHMSGEDAVHLVLGALANLQEESKPLLGLFARGALENTNG